MASDQAALERARDAVLAQRFASALDHLLTAWHTRPGPRLAAIISEVSQRSATSLPMVEGRKAAAIAAWRTRASRATAADRPALLATLCDAPSAEAIRRLEVVADWMPDPRVDDAIATWIEVVPYRATSTQPFWNALWPLARAIRDPRQVARIERAEGYGVARTMAEWLRPRFAKLAEQLTPLTAVTGESPLLDDIETALAKRGLSIRSQNLAALLAAVYDAPHDDAPRMVYGDALLERGDPRGEFIATQIRLARGDGDAGELHELRRRERELIATHGKAWLGELASIIRPGFRFERGFLACCTVDNRHLDRVQQLAGHPAWSTVRSFAGAATIALDPIMKSLRTLEFTASEARNYEGLADSWTDLLVERERPLEQLTYRGIESSRTWEDALENNQSVRPGVQGRWVDVPLADELAALSQCRALPGLTTLVIAADPDLVARPLLTAPVTRRLNVLGFVYDTRSERAPLRWFTEALIAAPVPTLRFTLNPNFHPTTIELERGERGYHRVAIELGPTSRDNWSGVLVGEAIAILDILPATVRELRIKTRRHTAPAQVTRLRAAVAQMALDLGEVS